MTASRKSSPPVVKLKPETHAKLQEWSREEHRPMGEIVTDLVERYEEERFWTRVRGQLAALKADPVAWQDYLDELALFDQMAGDGLEHEEPYDEPAEEEEIQQQAAHAHGR
jgi:hypothetical protein